MLFEQWRVFSGLERLLQARHFPSLPIIATLPLSIISHAKSVSQSRRPLQKKHLFTEQINHLHSKLIGYLLLTIDYISEFPEKNIAVIFTYFQFVGFIYVVIVIVYIYQRYVCLKKNTHHVLRTAIYPLAQEELFRD